MSNLFIAISLYFASLLVAFGFIMLGAYKDKVSFMVLGWVTGVIGEFAAVIYSVMWIVWLFKQ